MRFRPIQFEVGNEYRDNQGNLVRMVQRDDTKGNETILGKDGVWRYNRLDYLGQVCLGVKNDPRNLVPLYVADHSMLSDAEALDEIAELLREERWDVGFLEDIDRLVRLTGRDLDTPLEEDDE